MLNLAYAPILFHRVIPEINIFTRLNKMRSSKIQQISSIPFLLEIYMRTSTLIYFIKFKMELFNTCSGYMFLAWLNTKVHFHNSVINALKPNE